MENQFELTEDQKDNMDNESGNKPVRNQHEGKTQTPDDLENNKSGLGGNFDKGQSESGASPGTSTADAEEEQDSDTPIDDEEQEGLRP
ncbi:MAG: hypothetical protein HYX60_01730 [Legionella longbeachae]|nr:hypothetical protein [Legionella longbeachae]